MTVNKNKWNVAGTGLRLVLALFATRRGAKLKRRDCAQWWERQRNTTRDGEGTWSTHVVPLTSCSGGWFVVS